MGFVFLLPGFAHLCSNILMIAIPKKIRLKLGQIVATQGAIEALKTSSQSPLEFLKRHSGGDWGEICGEDWAIND